MFRMAALIVVAAGAMALAQSPSEYTVTPQAGPWMICVASYRGDEAKGAAEELCRDLRTGYKVAAYTFNRADEERRTEAQRVATLREQHKRRLREAGLPEDTPIRIKTIRIEDQVAVLVGGWKDDTTARKHLDDLRKITPPEKLQFYVELPGPGGKPQKQVVSPFVSAFVCRNPSLAPTQVAKDDAPDPRLKEYNSGESFSLLKCRHPWTLVVKSYAGATVLQQKYAPNSIMEKIGSLGKGGAILNANANQAHEVAEFLRKFGFEAYVLHTEYSSYVTIGSYDSPDDPRLLQAQQMFMNEMKKPDSNVGQLHVRAGVQFMPQPMPMHVPQVK